MAVTSKERANKTKSREPKNYETGLSCGKTQIKSLSDRSSPQKHLLRCRLKDTNEAKLTNGTQKSYENSFSKDFEKQLGANFQKKSAKSRYKYRIRH